MVSLDVPLTAAQRDEKHRKDVKDVEDGINNPVSWYHWNKEVSPMDSKVAWQDGQYQAWRNAQVQKSGSYNSGSYNSGSYNSGSYNSGSRGW